MRSVTLLTFVDKNSRMGEKAVQNPGLVGIFNGITALYATGIMKYLPLRQRQTRQLARTPDKRMPGMIDNTSRKRTTTETDAVVSCSQIRDGLFSASQPPATATQK